jgi:hypothetical protein
MYLLHIYQRVNMDINTWKILGCVLFLLSLGFYIWYVRRGKRYKANDELLTRKEQAFLKLKYKIQMNSHVVPCLDLEDGLVIIGFVHHGRDGTRTPLAQLKVFLDDIEWDWEKEKEVVINRK